MTVDFSTETITIEVKPLMIWLFAEFNPEANPEIKKRIAEHLRRCDEDILRRAMMGMEGKD